MRDCVLGHGITLDALEKLACPPKTGPFAALGFGSKT